MPAPIFTSVDDLLDDLGITEPEELDLTVIAQHCQATILYKPLESCAARIAGSEDRAIITIDSNSRVERQRFSAGHELGHWMFDRGQVSVFSCAEGVFIREWSRHNPETRANRYASDLLMPVRMFKQRSAVLKRIDFNTVNTLAKTFTTSLSATAIRLVEHGPLPAMIICSSLDRVEWFVRGDGTERLWPQHPSPATYAYDILHGTRNEGCGDVSASSWFHHSLAEHHSVHEHSVRAYQGLVLSLLWWRNESLLIELDESEEERDGRYDDHWRR